MNKNQIFVWSTKIKGLPVSEKKSDMLLLEKKFSDILLLEEKLLRSRDTFLEI